MAIRAKYAGQDSDTGRNYDAGTMIEKGPNGWRIAGEVQEWRTVRMAPLAIEFGGTEGAEPSEARMNMGQPIFCSCCKTLPGFDAKNRETYAGCEYDREGDTLTCPRCGRTGEILPEPKPVKRPAEVRRCWECGCEFTFADAKRNGGDWNENGGYCGC